MAKDIAERLEEMSDLLLSKSPTAWLAASLLTWEAAQHIKKLRERPSEIYVSALNDPEE